MTQSEITRRQFLESAGTISSLTAAGMMIMKQAHGQAADSTVSPSCLDYRRSFVCGTSALNSLRLCIESRTTIINTATGNSVQFYQCASCKSENTFGDSDLFLPDNYDFLPIVGAGHWLVFRRHARFDPERYRETVPLPNAWGDPRMLIPESTDVRILNTWEEIRDATAQGVPLVSQTEIMNSDTSLKAVIECPVKTMNISLEKQMYQVDTGPVAFPDLKQTADPLINCLQLAFVAFNQSDFADFIIEQPTPVIENKSNVCRIYHYSNPISLPATNRILTHA